MNDVLIHSPFPRQDNQGNSITSERLKSMLVQSGFSVVMETETYQGQQARCMVALNARRSAQAVNLFRKTCPDAKVIVIITGTDINHAEMAESMSPTLVTMQDADALVVLHEVALTSVPDELREKCHVIYPSLDLPEGMIHQSVPGDHFQVVMAGNLRLVKNPQLAIEACKILPPDSSIRVSAYGAADEDMIQVIDGEGESATAFSWQGKTDHGHLLQIMSRSQLLLNTSTQEGGANAICEAISMGLPVVASHIQGNVGMLGADYTGYFPSGDAKALANLLYRCATDTVFYGELKSHIAARGAMFSYAVECKAWVDLLSQQLGG